MFIFVGDLRNVAETSSVATQTEKILEKDNGSELIFPGLDYGNTSSLLSREHDEEEYTIDDGAAFTIILITQQ